MFTKTGARYDGEWKKGLKHGFGKFYYPDGSVYCGEWKQNKKHGNGKYIYENGDVYEGNKPFTFKYFEDFKLLNFKRLLEKKFKKWSWNLQISRIQCIILWNICQKHATWTSSNHLP